MRRICKTFGTLARAERYQNQLYARFNYVRLLDWPRFTESGRYTWEVK